MSEQLKCDVCGATNSEGSKFCRVCGACLTCDGAEHCSTQHEETLGKPLSPQALLNNWEYLVATVTLKIPFHNGDRNTQKMAYSTLKKEVGKLSASFVHNVKTQKIKSDQL